MKSILSLTLVLSLAVKTFAAWTYDSSTRRATDGSWTLQLHPYQDGLQLGNSNNSGSAIVQMPEDRNLDLSSFYNDTGLKIYGVYQNGFRGTYIESLNAPDVYYIAAQAFYSCTNLKSLIFSPALSSVGSSAFYECKKLESFSPTTINIATIPDYMFQTCSALDIALSFPIATSIGSKAFQSSKVNHVSAPNVATINGSAFQNNASIKEVLVPNCTAINGEKTFWGCYALTNVVCSSQMTTIGVNAFYQCSALKSFSPYLSDALTSMSRGANFNKCTVLTGALRIASPSLTTIAYAAFANGPAKNFIGPVEIYSPIDTIGDLTFNPCKDSQVFNFYSSVVPTSIGGAAFRANKTRVIINIHSSEAVAGWRNLCAANDATFETMKGYEDYPGKKTIGVLLNGTQYHWVVNCSPSNSGTSIFIM